MTDASNIEFNAPTGTIIYFPGLHIPHGWLLCDGTALSKTVYADLYDVLGNLYGETATEFKLPDVRGYFVRAYDSSRGADPGRAMGTLQGDAIRNIEGTIAPMVPGHHANFRSGAFGALNSMAPHNSYTPNNEQVPWGYNFKASYVVPTASDNRPKNIAFNAIIKY